MIRATDPDRRAHVARRNIIQRPYFITIAMWFAWLLRRDARYSATLNDQEAQRDFVAWWLLYGRSEYPAVWWYGPEQTAVAMETVTCCGHELPRLVRRVWLTRDDVRSAFPLVTAAQAVDLLCWYRLSGPIELAVAPGLPEAYLHLTEVPCDEAPSAEETPLPPLALALFARSPDLQRMFDLRSRSARRVFLDWYKTKSFRLIPAPTETPAYPEPAPPPRGKTANSSTFLGVNLVGFSRAEFGIGEDVRSASVALEAAGVPHTILDVPAMAHVRSRDTSRAHRVSNELRYNISVLCLTPFDTAQLYLERGPALFRDRYVIGYWPWELPQFPRMWAEAFMLVDEIWAATRFQMRAFQAATALPVVLMPPAVVVPPSSILRALAPKRSRTGKFRFLMPFDPSSFFTRKNPIAAIRAFRRAFPLADRTVELVLRVNGRPGLSPEWRAILATRRGDTRITFKLGTLDRAHALAILADADCLLSPHRAEGFGRNIAEAIALGVPVLATGFSGPVDFLRPCEQVHWAPRAVRAGEYPFADDLWWAEPSVAHMAHRMRLIRQHSGAVSRTPHNAQNVGARLRAHLSTLRPLSGDLSELGRSPNPLQAL